VVISLCFATLLVSTLTPTSTDTKPIRQGTCLEKKRMLSELFSALIPKAHAEEQAAKPAKEENSGADAEGEAKVEEEPEPEDVRCLFFFLQLEIAHA
jgi:hypothetical protein